MTLVDPVATSIIEENIESLTLFPDPGVLTALVHTLAPKLAAAISTPVTDETVHIPGEAVQLANSMIRMRGGPLETELVATITMAVMGILRTTDDMDVIQVSNGLRGKECIGLMRLAWNDSFNFGREEGLPKTYTLVGHSISLVDYDTKSLCRQDVEGNNGIASIFGLLGRFLAPTFSESGGIFVGELIMHLFRKAGEAIGPVLPDLLRAVVTRLATATMPSFTQVCFPFRDTRCAFMLADFHFRLLSCPLPTSSALNTLLTPSISSPNSLFPFLLEARSVLLTLFLSPGATRRILSLDHGISGSAIWV